MKILVVCQYYYPEPVRTSDICEELVKQGHDVTVITDVPNYPMGNVYDGYKKIREEVRNGVKIYRCFTIPRKKGVIMRFLNYYSFSISSTLFINKLNEKFDRVFVYQLSPVMMANAAIKYKKKNNTKMILYCLDLWPESLCAGGIKQNSLIYNIYKNISKKIYYNADKILITSKTFKSYFNEKFNINDDKIEYLPQYAESLFIPEKCRKIGNGNIDLLFAGNIGKAQNIDLIIKAADILRDIKNLNWHVVGDGSEFQNCKKMVEDLKLTNFFLYGRKPLEEMPDYYSKADAMIVTLSGDSVVSTTLPGKVQSYMAAGKPIIASANGETKIVIDEAQCGFCAKADDIDDLVRVVKEFIEYSDKNKLGENAYNFYKINFEKNMFMDKLLKNFKDL